MSQNSRPKKTDWNRLAERELAKILDRARTIPAIRKLGPKPQWTVSVSMIGSLAMKRLNAKYRGKNRSTDVLSFSPPEVFFDLGHLGELVICLPVLKSQAREFKHKPELELKILLIHGLLHLLGLDHEKGPKQAAEQARMERKLLESLVPLSLLSLIQRAK